MTSPLELLTNSGERKPSFLSDKWNPLACAVAGFCMACFINFGMRKPVFSGLQQHTFLTVGGGALGSYIDKKRSAYMDERDAVLRHYIELHPEDFPTPERKKYADVLDIWVPVR